MSGMFESKILFKIAENADQSQLGLPHSRRIEAKKKKYLPNQLRHQLSSRNFEGLWLRHGLPCENLLIKQSSLSDYQ